MDSLLFQQLWPTEKRNEERKGRFNKFIETIQLENISESTNEDVTKRIERLKSIMKRAKTLELKLKQLATLLKFKNETTLLDWLFSLPDNFSFKVEKNIVIFSEDIEETINALLEEFKEWKKE